MNLNKLICIAAVIGFSSNAFAMEIYKGKVISQKVWSNDGSKAKVTAKRTPQMRHTGNGDEQVIASITSWNTSVNEHLQMNNMNHISLQNDSDETKKYYILESVCSQTSDNFNRCIYYHAQLELEANGSAYIDETPYLEMAYSKPGRYRVTTTSTVYDHNGQDSSQPHHSGAVATIFVS